MFVFIHNSRGAELRENDVVDGSEYGYVIGPFSREQATLIVARENKKSDDAWARARAVTPNFSNWGL